MSQHVDGGGAHAVGADAAIADPAAPPPGFHTGKFVIASSATGLADACLFYPLSLIKTRQQVAGAPLHHYHHHHHRPATLSFIQVGPLMRHLGALSMSALPISPAL